MRLMGAGFYGHQEYKWAEKKELKKIIEGLLNTQMQNQPLALAAPEQQINRSHQGILEEESVLPCFLCSFPKYPLLATVRGRSLAFYRFGLIHFACPYVTDPLHL